MQTISRYSFCLVGSAFLVTLVTLTAVIWVTQALREFDLLTSKGQTLGIFFLLTGLSVPLLVMVIAPVALFIATLWALSKLNADSELIVISAAGASPFAILRPFLLLGLIVSLIAGAIAVHFAPASMRALREMVTQVRADVVANIVQEGRFTTIEDGLTFHVRERGREGVLRGIFVNDARTPGEQTTFLAEIGQITEVEGQPFLILQNGSMQRRQARDRDPSIVLFERYVFDLSQFSGNSEDTWYKPREKYLSELIWPAPDDPYWKLQPGRFRAELHERLSAALYPLVFVLIAFSWLGKARTTRQSRAFALAGAAISVLVLRIAGFALTSAAARADWAVPLIYLLPLAVSLFCLGVISGRIRPHLPAGWVEAHERLLARLSGAKGQRA